MSHGAFEECARSLDRRRLAENWYRWSILRWYEHEGTLQDVTLDLSVNNLDDTILNLLPELRMWFTKKWTGLHHSEACGHNQCSEAFSIDGHFKVKRSVCDCRKGVFVQSEELGAVATGCPFTPKVGSFYCSEHAARTATKGDSTASLDAASVHVCEDEEKETPEECKPEKSLVDEVIGKRVGKGGWQYRVRWIDDGTSQWLDQSALTPQLVLEYNSRSRLERFRKRKVVEPVVPFSISAEEAQLLRPYLQLAQCLGSFVGQLTHDPIKTLTVTYGGEANDLNVSPLTIQVVQSILEQHSSYVNSVNARELARDRNINVIEAHNEGRDEYPCRITVAVETESKARSICGTLIQNRPRVIDVRGIPLESKIGEHMLYITNLDTPGVIGAIGTTTEKRGINIANLHLGRDSENENAIALLEVDESPSDEDLNQLRSLPNINAVQYLHFPALR